MKGIESNKQGLTSNKYAMIRKYGLFLALFLLILTFSIARPSTFFTTGNMMIILTQISINGILAVGMTFIIISGGIDLSVGSILAYSAIVAANYAHPGTYPVIVPILIALGLGALLGAINGFIISRGDIPPFIVTLGMLTIARGLTQLYNDGRPVNDLSSQFNFLGGGKILGVPVPVIIFAVVIFVGWFVLNKTKFGRYVYAVGGNSSTAEASGINVKNILTKTYMLSGLLAAISGIVLTARVETATVIAGTGYELDAIAAVVIGGTSMTGGKGKIGGTIIGVLIIGILSNGLDLMGVPSYYQQIIKGIIIIAAVLFDKKGNEATN